MQDQSVQTCDEFEYVSLQHTEPLHKLIISPRYPSKKLEVIDNSDFYSQNKVYNQVILSAKNKNNILNIIREEKQNIYKDNIYKDKQIFPHLPISPSFQGKLVKSIIQQRAQEFKKKWQEKQNQQISQTKRKVRRISMMEFLPITDRKFQLNGQRIKSKDNSPLFSK